MVMVVGHVGIVMGGGGGGGDGGDGGGGSTYVHMY